MFSPALRPKIAKVLSPKSLRCVHSKQTFSENDLVLLRHCRDPEISYLTRPLNAEKTLHTHLGSVPHSAILNRRVRDVISSHKNIPFRLTYPTLEEYVTKVKRLVTPVYPLDAATIVSLLDIHVAAPNLTDAFPAPVEILEAGTGHGSLTLALCKAVHAANSHLPYVNNDLTRRGAIIHTLDNRPAHSSHAREIVHGFRKGLYKHDAEFYVGEPSSWVESQLASRRKSSGSESEEPFLSHAILDLPGPETHIGAVTKGLIPDGILGLWCPSITQIVACVKSARENRVPITMDRVVEFPGGTGVGAGLRRWDVRFAKVRSRANAEPAVKSEDAAEDGAVKKEDLSEFEVVCRPMVGERLVGGGFFAIFRKMREDSAEDRSWRGSKGKGENVVVKEKEEGDAVKEKVEGDAAEKKEDIEAPKEQDEVDIIIAQEEIKAVAGQEEIEAVEEKEENFASRENGEKKEETPTS
ncbi:hypothetical protein RUND412_003820 [Rhizina undulata]